MSKTGSVQTITPSQMKELGSAAQQSVPVDLPFTAADYWEHNKGELVRRFAGVLRSAPVNIDSPVLTKVMTDCRKALRRAFGRRCPEVGPLPASVTEELVAHWAKFNMRPIFLPELDLTETCRLPKRWIRPEAWFYQKLREEKVGGAIPGVLPTKIRSGWYLADFSVGVDYTDGSQVFPNDPLAPIIADLRQKKLVGRKNNTPDGSRFAITFDEWQDYVLAYIPSKLGVTRAQTCLERAVEFNAIGNLYDANRGKFNAWEWFADPFEGSSRLIGGHRDCGGLASVDYVWRGSRGGGITGRPLVSLV